MGKLRQIEKKVTKGQTNNNQQVSEFKSLLMIMLAVITIFLIFTAITSLVNPKKQTEAIQVAEETIQYDNIIVGEIFNRLEKDYYVLVLKEDNVYNDLYQAYLDMYVSDKTERNYYTIDLRDAFNQSYLGEETFIKGNDISKYSFNNTVLIKIKKNEIDKTYVSHDEILKALKEMIK